MALQNTIKSKFKIDSNDGWQLDYLRGFYLLKSLIEKHDQYTFYHSLNVSRYAYIVGEEMAIDERGLQGLKIAALLHDIGKSCIPRPILQKKGPLDSREMAVIRTHSWEGARIVKNISLFREQREAILYHHERPDGMGYPFGLKGEEIPAAAAIINICDSFDAMITDRCYRESMSVARAVRELENNTGRQFAEPVVKAFLNVINNKRYGFKKVI